MVTLKNGGVTFEYLQRVGFPENRQSFVLRTLPDPDYRCGYRGLKLQVPEFIHPGTAIQIRLKRTIALAEVRYCHPAGTEFHVGVRLQDVFPSRTPNKPTSPAVGPAVLPASRSPDRL